MGGISFSSPSSFVCASRFKGRSTQNTNANTNTCRAHRHCKKLAASFPGVISEEQIRKKWEEYLALKRVAKALVKEKMLKEREDILKEVKQGGV